MDDERHRVLREHGTRYAATSSNFGRRGAGRVDLRAEVYELAARLGSRSVTREHVDRFHLRGTWPRRA